jgi:hypothetical protein
VDTQRLENHPPGLPAHSGAHAAWVLLSVLAERRLRSGQSAELGALLEDLAGPPIERVGPRR